MQSHRRRRFKQPERRAASPILVFSVARARSRSGQRPFRRATETTLPESTWSGHRESHQTDAGSHAALSKVQPETVEPGFCRVLPSFIGTIRRAHWQTLLRRVPSEEQMLPVISARHAYRQASSATRASSVRKHVNPERAGNEPTMKGPGTSQLCQFAIACGVPGALLASHCVAPANSRCGHRLLARATR